MFKIESTSIVLNRLRIRFSYIQLEETANRNFTGQHYTEIDIQPLLLFPMFDAMMVDSSVTSPYKSLLITQTPPPPLPRSGEAPTKSSISLGKTFLRVSARIWKLARTWILITRSFFLALTTSKHLLRRLELYLFIRQVL